MGPHGLQPEQSSKEATGRVPGSLLQGLRALLTTDKSVSQSSPLGAPSPPMFHVIRDQHRGTGVNEQGAKKPEVARCVGENRW